MEKGATAEAEAAYEPHEDGGCFVSTEGFATSESLALAGSRWLSLTLSLSLSHLLGEH